jgi:hypothetical protein
MIKTGDILKRKNSSQTVKVLGVCDEVYFISLSDVHGKANSGAYTLSELKERFEIPEEKWVPERGDQYYVADITEPDYYFITVRVNSKNDQMRLQRNLVFKTPEEAIARAKQLLGISE